MGGDTTVPLKLSVFAFRRYACGNWADEHPIPDTSLTNSWFDERRERMYRKIRESLRDNTTRSDVPWAVSQAKILYNSCMDVRTLLACFVNSNEITLEITNKFSVD